ncbi:ArsR/SmtB family transcription factor [Planosporangium mesophilum]|uniref:ArsR/SmtB family transcription factor n=1 Tax=Planosporangium mesophilum TaxID=689768 RepID=UPI00143A465C|nr:helix-turn-helix domain-containing protein [Planosporangium mesophilum]NJC83853.1 helix-turn-helix transcriptional regulator [Planosporangium mesophilum]
MGRVEIDFGVTRQPEVTIVESAVATTMTNIVEVYGPLRGRLPQAIQRRARSLSTSIDLRPLSVLFGRRDGWQLPDNLLPAGGASIEAELAPLRVKAGALAEQIAATHPHGVPLVLRPWVDRPRQTLDAYIAALQQYHDGVIRALYPQLRSRLRREVAACERALDDQPGMSLFARLNPRIDLSTVGRLRVETPDPPPGAPLHTRRMVLTPMVSDVRTLCRNGYGRSGYDQIFLGYAPPGLAVFSDEARPRGSSDPLACLMGASRAVILRQLERAATTTELAADVDLKPSTVSHHLAALLDADLVTASRVANTVYYRLTDRGWSVLRLYGSEP